MTPILWGPDFWFNLHSSAYAAKEEEMKNLLASLRTFYQLLWKYLLCPVCKPGCKEFSHNALTQNVFHDSMSVDEWWTFTVNFHNFVNKRTGKPEYTQNEARDFFESQYKPLQLPFPVYAFGEATWRFLLYVTVSGVQQLSASVSDSKNFTEVETEFRTFVTAALHLIPFRHHHDKLVPNMLQALNQHPTFESVRNTATTPSEQSTKLMEHGKELFRQWYNATCSFFGKPTLDTLQAVDSYIDERLMNPERVRDALQHFRVREADHRRIQELQQQQQQFPPKTETSINHNDVTNATLKTLSSTQETHVWKLLAIVFLVLFSMVTLILLYWIVRGRANRHRLRSVSSYAI